MSKLKILVAYAIIIQISSQTDKTERKFTASKRRFNTLDPKSAEAKR
jgi:hypothetical protein